MKKISIIKIFLLGFIFSTNFCFSQAIRINYFGVSDPVKAEAGTITTPLYFGFGYEQNIGDRIAISLEYNLSYDHLITLDDYNSVTASIAKNNLSYDYSLHVPYAEIRYTSKYFFSDNDDGSGYIATGISLQSLKYQWQFSGFSSLDYQGTYTLPSGLNASSYSENKISIPLTLLLGYRGVIDGSFGDYGIGVQFNLNGINKPTDPSFRYTGGTKIRNLRFVLHFSWGIGWGG